MKTLTLLRHAKSGWDDAVARDFDRPLNAKGKRAAAAMGRHLRGAGIGWDAVIASPAVRVTETLEHFAIGYGETLAPAWDRRVYLASVATLIDVVREADERAGRLLLVGHNPGMEELVLALVPDGDDPLRDGVEEKYPTAAVAELALDVAAWSDAGPNTARLTRFVRPRDLDASLGPDAD